MYKYIDVKNQIKAYIKTLEDDAKLPSYSKIAKLYNISDTTVRKALNELLKEQLIYCVSKKGIYKAKPKRVFHDVSVVVDSLYGKFLSSDSLFPWIIGHIEKRLRENDMDMLLSCFGDDFEFERSVITKLIDRKPYGAVVSPSGNRDNFDIYEKAVETIDNFIFLDRNIDSINAHYVGTDSYSLAYKMAKPLQNEDYDKIFIFVAYYQRALNSEYERLAGYNDALKGAKCQNVKKFYDTSLNAKTMFENVIKPYFEDEFKKGYKRIAFLCINTEVIEMLYNYFRDDIKKLDFCKVILFDKPPIEIEKNTSVVWGWQNVETISKKVLEILKEKPEKKQKIYIPGEIRYED